MISLMGIVVVPCPTMSRHKLSRRKLPTRLRVEPVNASWSTRFIPSNNRQKASTYGSVTPASNFFLAWESVRSKGISAILIFWCWLNSTGVILSKLSAIAGADWNRSPSGLNNLPNMSNTAEVTLLTSSLSRGFWHSNKFSPGAKVGLTRSMRMISFSRSLWIRERILSIASLCGSRKHPPPPAFTCWMNIDSAAVVLPVPGLPWRTTPRRALSRLSHTSWWVWISRPI